MLYLSLSKLHTPSLVTPSSGTSDASKACHTLITTANWNQYNIIFYISALMCHVKLILSVLHTYLHNWHTKEVFTRTKSLNNTKGLVARWRRHDPEGLLSLGSVLSASAHTGLLTACSTIKTYSINSTSP